MIAVFLLVIFAATLIYAAVAAFTTHWPEAKDLLLIVLPVETSLLGSALGFYFGSQRS